MSLAVAFMGNFDYQLSWCDILMDRCTDIQTQTPDRVISINHSAKLFPRGDAGGLSREYVLRVPSVS